MRITLIQLFLLLSILGPACAQIDPYPVQPIPGTKDPHPTKDSTQRPQKPRSSPLLLPGAFRARAEDLLDCLDEMNDAKLKSAAVYDAKDIQCQDKLKKLRRSASTPDERAMGDLMRDYYGKIGTCRLVLASDRHADEARSCSAEEEAIRSEAIKRGRLKA